MYTTNEPEEAKRPVITSLAGAIAEIDRWVRQNRFNKLSDSDGLMWDLDLKVTHPPDPDDPRGVLWEVVLAMTSDVNADVLLQTRTFDEKKDARLVGLLRDDTVRLAMEVARFRAKNEDDARHKLARVLPSLKANFQKNPLGEMKRNQIARYIDNRCILR